MNFIVIFNNIDTIIQRGISENKSEAEICDILKLHYQDINCEKITQTSFFKSIIDFFNQRLYGHVGSSRFQYKYLKYKKKYINMKK
jgi:hypothetical protein